MSLKGFSLSVINSICGRLFNHHLYPYSLDQGVLKVPNLDHALRRLAAHNIEIASIIDVGASNGIWSKAFAEHFPGRNYLLVEANQVYHSKLEALCQNRPNWRFAMTAVGDRTGELYFDSSDPLGGHLATTPRNENYRSCSVTTIDNLVKTNPLPGPFLIKLDTHGVEIPILSGAMDTLKQTNALVIEAYNFTFAQPAVPFWELCRYMLKLGFRPLDIFDPLYREVDNAFWQLDILFARCEHPLFQDTRYFVADRY